MQFRQILALTFVTTILLMTAALRADGPRDNDATTVRAVPPPGVEIGAEVRARLEKKVGELNAAVAELAKRSDARTRELLPDVQVFAKAADWALRYGEIFRNDDIARVEMCLDVGRERAAQLAEGKAPWTDARGLVVRGYVSRIDGSVQPYGLVVPESYTAQTAGKYRMDVWFHGRDETLSEANFIVGRMRDRGQFTPADTIVLHPYGRYCNAFKLAGEEDVNEAIEAVRRAYRVDDDRISVRGFSMGGAAAWHFAVHYPSRWFAANPGAGFSETPEFLRVFQGETIEDLPWQKPLLHYYDCTDWARNLACCPTIAYSGEIDSQKQAADIMERALAAEHLNLMHVIGPLTKHAYHPEAAATVERKMRELSRFGCRSYNPSQFSTYTLRYNQCGVATIDALGEHWRQARLDYRVDFMQNVRAVRVLMENVTAFTLKAPAGNIDPRYSVQVYVNVGEPMAGKIQSDGSWNASFHQVDGKWVAGSADDDKESSLRKRHGLQGPIDDAFLDSFLFARPTGKARSDAVEKWSHAEMERAAREWRRQMRGDVRIKDDRDITDADIAAHHLILWGDAQSNTLIRRVAEKLPIAWTDDQVTVGGQNYAAATHAPVMIYPNPLNAKKYVVLNSGLTYREYDYLNNARQVPKLPDWAVIDLTTPAGTRYCGKVVAAGFFDENWGLKK